jgi:hypothetical protein
MNEYSPVLTELNAELESPLVEILIATDKHLFDAVRNVKGFIEERACHARRSMAQEILCFELLFEIRKKKSFLEKKKEEVEQRIQKMNHEDFFDSFAVYLREINRIAPEQASSLLDILEQ